MKKIILLFIIGMIISKQTHNSDRKPPLDIINGEEIGAQLISKKTYANGAVETIKQLVFGNLTLQILTFPNGDVIRTTQNNFTEHKLEKEREKSFLAYEEKLLKKTADTKTNAPVAAPRIQSYTTTNVDTSIKRPIQETTASVSLQLYDPSTNQQIAISTDNLRKYIDNPDLDNPNIRHESERTIHEYPSGIVRQAYSDGTITVTNTTGQSLTKNSSGIIKANLLSLPKKI